MKDVHGWVQPLGIIALGLIEPLDLLLKHGENSARRITGLEPVSEWVLKEIVFGALLVYFQCIIENYLKVGGCRSRMCMRRRHRDGVRN